MYSTSGKFNRAIRTSGQRKTVLDVIEAFSNVYLFRDVEIISGSVTADRNSDIRRSGSITIGDMSFKDVFHENVTGPFGVELVIRSGIVYPEGNEELVPLGVFNIDDFSWREGDGGFPVVNFYDRSKYIQRAPLVQARDFSGKLAQVVIEEVVADVMPDIDVVFEVGLPNPKLPGGSVFDDDRWEIITTCLEAMGAEGYFDRLGAFQVVDIRDPTATDEAVVWQLNVGDGFSQIQEIDGQFKFVSRQDGILIDATRTVSRADTYNGVVVVGAAKDGTSVQPYALAFDGDSHSPTYYYGTFGKSIKRIDNSTLLTADDCATAAVAELKNTLGISRSIDFTAIPNPAVDEGDYIGLTFLDDTFEVHLLDSFTFPIGPGDFSGSTKTNPTRQTSSIAVKRGTTTLDFPPTRPGRPEVLQVTNSSIWIKWMPSHETVSPIQEYKVYFNGTERATFGARPTSEIHEVNVGGLTAGTRYDIYVTCIDDAGLVSEPSDTIRQKTTGTAPPTPPAPAPKKYTKSYLANWSISYYGSGEAASFHGTRCYQGYDTAGNGNMRSLIGFDDEKIRSDTSGAEILECYVTLHYEEWGRSTGGTAIIGTHSYDDRPTTWTDSQVSQDRVRSTGWPQNRSRTVSLGTTIGKAFKSGSAKGIALGPGPTISDLYFGRAEGAGNGVLTPTLKIVYRK